MPRLGSNHGPAIAVDLHSRPRVNISLSAGITHETPTIAVGSVFKVWSGRKTKEAPDTLAESPLLWIALISICNLTRLLLQVKRLSRFDVQWKALA